MLHNGLESVCKTTKAKEETHPVVNPRLVILIVLVAEAVFAICGCGGGSRAGNSNPPPIGSNAITFASTRALDGSDNANTNNMFNIWVMNADGSGVKTLTQLTTRLADSLRPVWSPDGGKIAFESTRALDGSDNANTNSTSNIWVMNADGSGAKALTQLTAPVADSSFPVWSPDGSKIAFASRRALDGSNTANANFTANIWVMNADGSSAKAQTHLTAVGALSSSPVWSPDGSKIAFSSMRALDGTDNANTNTTSNIWVMNADGSSAKALTLLTAIGSSSGILVWSPDGSKIAFQSSRALDGTNNANTNLTDNIWVVNADGSGAKALTQLTALVADSSLPVWSPDGSKIAFQSSRALDGSNNANTNLAFNIWVVNADGTGAKALTQLTAQRADSGFSRTVWSPDGSKIVFDSRRALDGSNNANTNFAFNVWVVNANGTAAKALTQLTRANSSDPNER